VEDSGVGAAGGQARLRLGLQQADPHPPARKLQRDRASDHAGPDDRNLDILPQSC